MFLFSCAEDKEKQAKYFEIAQKMYTSVRFSKLCAPDPQVLKRDPKMAYAANGIGCILAYKGEFLKAKDVFMKVRCNFGRLVTRRSARRLVRTTWRWLTRGSIWPTAMWSW